MRISARYQVSFIYFHSCLTSICNQMVMTDIHMLYLLFSSTFLLMPSQMIPLFPPLFRWLGKRVEESTLVIVTPRVLQSELWLREKKRANSSARRDCLFLFEAREREIGQGILTWSSLNSTVRRAISSDVIWREDIFQ